MLHPALSLEDARVVLVGGGGGVYRVAKYLKRFIKNITTVHTVFDSGGHTGQLRRELGMLAVGDIRRGILALAGDNVPPKLIKMLECRFPESAVGSSFENAALGNLILAAFSQCSRDNLVLAIRELCELYNVEGKVLPVSLDYAHLKVVTSKGEKVFGEHNIDVRKSEGSITQLELDEPAVVLEETADELRNADMIVFCPGDQYTSIFPNLLVDGFNQAVYESHATIVACANIMTKKAETPYWSASQYAFGLNHYLVNRKVDPPVGRVADVLIYNTGEISPEITERYWKEESARPVVVNEKSMRYLIERTGIRTIGANLVEITNGRVRHSSQIATEIVGILQEIAIAA